MTQGLTASADAELRGHIRALLTQRQAHATLQDALEGFPVDRIHEHPEGVPYSAWELLWHLRFAQRDILNFVQDETYTHLTWPEAYWPQQQSATSADWQGQIQAFQEDLTTLLALLDDAQIDLFAVVANGDKQTWLREFLLVADHNAYHVGQLMLLRRMLG